jgi:5-methylcytosine-specific restriction protein A
MPNKFNREWSDTELAAAVDAYLDMLRYEQNGKPFNKAEINRALRESGAALEGRTKASVEYRMQNISAVLKSEKLTTVKGYAPASNVGDHIRVRLLRILKERRKIN